MSKVIDLGSIPGQVSDILKKIYLIRLIRREL